MDHPLTLFAEPEKDTSFPAKFKSPKAVPPLEMSSQLQHNQSIKLAQLCSPAKPMAPCILAILIAPDTCILTSAGIMPDSETLLCKSNIPEDDSNRGDHNEVAEAIVGTSSVDMNPSPFWNIPTLGVTAMMDDTRSYNRSETPGHQPEAPTRSLFPRNLTCPKRDSLIEHYSMVQASYLY